MYIGLPNPKFFYKHLFVMNLNFRYMIIGPLCINLMIHIYAFLRFRQQVQKRKYCLNVNNLFNFLDVGE